MNLPLFIARKYFVSKKKKNFINIISIISMVGVAVGTMALIIGLSFFNGLEDILRNLYGTFDSQIKVEASKGKSFVANKSLIDSIAAVSSVTTALMSTLFRANSCLKKTTLQGLSLAVVFSTHFLFQPTTISWHYNFIIQKM